MSRSERSGEYRPCGAALTGAALEAAVALVAPAGDAGGIAVAELGHAERAASALACEAGSIAAIYQPLAPRVQAGTGRRHVLPGARPGGRRSPAYAE